MSRGDGETNHAALAGGWGCHLRQERGKTSSRPSLAGHARLEAVPGPRVLAPARDPAGSRTPPFPRQRQFLDRRTAPTASPPGIETGPSWGRAPWSAGRGHIGGGARGRHSVGPSLACHDLRDPRSEGRALHLRAAADNKRRGGRLPPRRGVTIARHPPPGVAARGRQTAPRGFQGLQRQQQENGYNSIRARAPLRKCPRRVESRGRGGGRLSSCARGLAALHAPSGQRQ